MPQTDAIFAQVAIANQAADASESVLRPGLPENKRGLFHVVILDAHKNGNGLAIRSEDKVFLLCKFTHRSWTVAQFTCAYKFHNCVTVAIL